MMTDQNDYNINSYASVCGTTEPRSGGTGEVVEAVCLESQRSRARTPLKPLSFKEANVSSPLTREE